MRIFPLLSVVGVIASVSPAAEDLQRSVPEAQGVTSSGLLRLVEDLDSEIEGMHSVMVLRHGQVVAEGWWAPYTAERNHVLYSLSKSFASTAVGLAVEEGKLSLDDKVFEIFPDEAPAEVSENAGAMRVRDLLAMAAGHSSESPTAKDTMSAKTFLAHPVPHPPGTRFLYNTAATFLCSAIVQKRSGQTALDYLRPRLFEPLGIADPGWETNFQGISLGGYGLRARTEDIARFGQLYLQKGEWEGKRLLSPEWVAMATSKQIDNGSDPKSDWAQGYGFQFWQCRHGAYRGDGAFGQYCVVLPKEDAVVAITGGHGKMQGVLDILWDRLLPALTPDALPPDGNAAEELRSKLGGLGLRAAAGQATSPREPEVSGKVYRFPENGRMLESVVLTMDDEGKARALVARIDGKDVRLPFGHRKWVFGRGPFSAGSLADFPDEALAGTYGWTTEDTCEFRLCAVETPFVATWRLRFEGETVALEAEVNVAFGPTASPRLLGRRAP